MYNPCPWRLCISPVITEMQTPGKRSSDPKLRVLRLCTGLLPYLVALDSTWLPRNAFCADMVEAIVQVGRQAQMREQWECTKEI